MVGMIEFMFDGDTLDSGVRDDRLTRGLSVVCGGFSFSNGLVSRDSGQN